MKPQYLALGGLFALAGALGIGRFIYTPILPGMVEALGQSKSEAGLIASANFVGYLAGALAAASPRLGSRTSATLVAALVVSALTTAAMALPSTLIPFLVLRFVGGVASAFALVLSSALVLERLAASGHGHLSAIHFAGVGIGIAASAVLTWLLESEGAGWRAMWVGGGMLALATAVAAAALIKGDQAQPAAAATATGGRRANPHLAVLAVAYGLFGFGYVITATFIVAIVRGAPELRSLEPLIWLTVGLVAIPSVAVWIALARRIGAIRAYACASIVQALGVMLSVITPSAAALLVTAALLGGTFMGLTALGLIGARQLSGSDPRRSLALLTAAFGVGQIIGPVVAGYGFDLTGSFFAPSVLAAAGLCIAGGLALAIARPS